MEQINFKQVITNQDIIEYNFELQKQRSGKKYLNYFLYAIMIGVSIYQISTGVTKNILAGVFLICLALFMIASSSIFMKRIIRKKVMAQYRDTAIKIAITVDDTGIIYKIDREEKEELDNNSIEELPDEEKVNKDLYRWETFEKAVETSNFIYLTVNKFSILVIKKSEIENLEPIQEKLDYFLILGIKYIRNIKK